MKRLLYFFISLYLFIGISLPIKADSDEAEEFAKMFMLYCIAAASAQEEYAEYYLKIDSIMEMADWRDSIFKENLDKNGKILHHVVEKGEDWESIADDYKISQLDLMWANPFEEDCYAGLELSIPALQSEEELREFQLTVKNAYYIEGKRQYDKGDYSKAKKDI